jgi:hypothetical protein
MDTDFTKDNIFFGKLQKADREGMNNKEKLNSKLDNRISQLLHFLLQEKIQDLGLNSSGYD